MQQIPSLLSASDLTTARRAAYSSLSCDVGQVCNSTVVELHYALLRAVLALGLLDTDELSQLLPAEAWGVTLESSCADGGVHLILPEPVVRPDGSAPTAAVFHLTLNGGAAVLNTTTLAGPWQSGGGILYVLELGPELLPSGGEVLTLSIEEETLVAPLRGLMPRMTLSTPLANCHAPFIVSITALPVNESGSLTQEGWGAAVQATAGLQIVFSEGVASRAEDGTLSPLDAASFHVVTPNGTEVLEVRTVLEARRQLLDVEAYVSEAVILLGLSATPGDEEVVGLSVLEGRVVDQQGNAMVGGILWADLQPGLPTGPGCPWLGGMMVSALMAALSFLELSLRLLPEKLRICGRRRGISRKSKYILPEPAPAVPLPRETLPSSPPASPPAAPQLTRTMRKLEAAEARQNRKNGKQEDSAKQAKKADPPARASFDMGLARASYAIHSGADVVVGDKPKLGIVVWIVSMMGSAFLLAWGSARQVQNAPVVPLLPVWFAQGFLLSGQCGKRQSGHALLPALRTLGVCVMSIAVAFVTGIPSATDLSPLRRLMIVGPAALVAALFIAVDAVFKKRKASSGSEAARDSSQSFPSELDSPSASFLTQRILHGARRDATRDATRAVWTAVAKDTACKCRMAAAFAQAGSPPPSKLSPPSPSQQRSSCEYQSPPLLPHEQRKWGFSSRRSSTSTPSCLRVDFTEIGVSPPPENSASPPPSPPGCSWRREKEGLQPPQTTGRSLTLQPTLKVARLKGKARTGAKAIAKAMSSGGAHAAPRRASWLSRTCPRPQWPRRSRCCVVLPSRRPVCRSKLGPAALLRELGLEALRSLALLVTVLATAVGVPPFSVGDGTFKCHSIPMSVVGTVTALLAPMLPDLLQRMRGQSNGQGKSITPTLNLGLNDVEKGGDRTTAEAWRPAQLSSSDREWRDQRSSGREAATECRARQSSSREAVDEWHARRVTWREAYEGTTGKKPPDAPTKPPTAADTKLRNVVGHVMQAPSSAAGTMLSAELRREAIARAGDNMVRVQGSGTVFNQSAFQDRIFLLKDSPCSSKCSSFSRFAGASTLPTGVTQSLHGQRLWVPSQSDEVGPDCGVERTHDVSLPAPRVELEAVGDGPDVGEQTCVRCAAAELVQWSDVHPKSRHACSTGVRARIQPGEIDDDDDDGRRGSKREAEAAPFASHLRSLLLSGAAPRGRSTPPPRSSKAPAISSRIPRLSYVVSQSHRARVERPGSNES